MNEIVPCLLPPLIFLLAALYSSVGHAGASGYLAAMALLGVSASVMRPAALVLNIFVATIATISFARAGCFRWSLWWPFAVSAVIAAYFGGTWKLTDVIYKQIVGTVLLFAAARLVWQTLRPAPEHEPRLVPIPIALLLGAAIGLLAGLTSTGGGIFLTPCLLFFGWATPRVASGVSAPFILVASISGLVGQMRGKPEWSPDLGWWILAAVLGGLIGSHFGSRRLPSPTLCRLLAAVLLIAGVKLIAGA